MPNALVLDQATGFLDSLKMGGFTAEKKELFLELIQDNPHHGGVTQALQAIGISFTTFWRHLAADSQLRKQWQELKKVHAYKVEGVLANKALDPKATLAQIFYLKAHLPETYDRASLQQSAVQVNVSIGMLDNAIQRASVVEAQAVPTNPPTAITQQVDNTTCIDAQHVPQ